MNRVFEGTWEEIKTHEAEPTGRRLQVIVQCDDAPPETPHRPFYQTATPPEWSRAWREWTGSHDPDTPLLSDDAISRDSIYEGTRLDLST